MLLNVQLFDSPEPGYKRMRSRWLQAARPPAAASAETLGIEPIPKRRTNRPMWVFERKEKKKKNQSRSVARGQQASRLAGVLMQIQMLTLARHADVKPWPVWNH